jgi:hypothetical protein
VSDAALNDTQPVLEQIRDVLHRWGGYHGDTAANAVFHTVVAPILNRAERAEADRAATRQRIEAALTIHAEHVAAHRWWGARPGWIENSCVCVACRMVRALDDEGGESDRLHEER